MLQQNNTRHQSRRGTKQQQIVEILMVLHADYQKNNLKEFRIKKRRKTTPLTVLNQVGYDLLSWLSFLSLRRCVSA